MKLVTHKIFEGAEIIHFADSRCQVTSRGNFVRIHRRGDSGEESRSFRIPAAWWSSLGMPFRLSRRALRLDKCNIVVADAAYEHFVVIYQGQVYSYVFSSNELRSVFKLNNCRTVLHQSVASVDGKHLFMGEYGANSTRGPVPVYGSSDHGRSWRVVYEFAEKTIKHVHGCYWDPYEEKVWVTTGDFPGECQMLVADLGFKEIEKLGDGQQSWRAVCLFFRPEAVYWVMDSQLETNHLMRLDRATRRVSKLRSFPGPVWYGKDLADGVALVATANEIGPGVQDDRAHVFASRDLESWNEVVSYSHDRLPKRYFKFGVVGFADGAQSSDRFYLFGEALRGLDGKVVECSIVQTQANSVESAPPLFKHLTPEILEDLFRASQEDAASARITAWAPALLRGSELQQGRLVAKFRELWRADGETALWGALLVAVVLEIHGAATRDLRYLNAVLKILDEISGAAEGSRNALLLKDVGARVRRQLESLS